MDKLETRGKVANPKRIAGLDINPAHDGYLVYHQAQDRIHFLNATAVLVLELCNGEVAPDDMAELIKRAYQLPEPPLNDVREVLTQLKAEGLLL